MATHISAYSSTPRTRFIGIKDEGAVSIAMPVESVPIRFPLFAAFSPIGDYDEPLAVNGSSISLTHGNDVIQPRSKFYNHQTHFMRTHFEAGGSAIFLRLKADGAKRSTARLGIDIVEDELVQYELNADGSYRRNSEGELVPTGQTVLGHRAQLKIMEISEIDGVSTFGKAKPAEGMMVSSVDGEASTFYPLVDIEGRWDGSLYNNVGFRMFAPSALDREPIDEELVETLGARPYRLQIVQRANESSSPFVIPTMTSEQFLNFTFVDAIDDRVGAKEYNIARIFKETYETEKPEEFNGYGPFSDLHVYSDHLEDVLTLLASTESDYTNEEIENIHTFNFMTGSDLNEIPYHTYRVEGPRDGGILMSENTAHFLRGGDDGDVSQTAFNEKFDDMLTSMSVSHIPFEDIARMPFDSIFDSGFPLETKLKFVEVHNLRPDVYPHVCTQDVSKPINSPSEDSSVLLTLRSMFRSQIESPEHGTKATRFALFNCAGYLADDDYKGLVPFMEFIMLKGAEYMGAASGKMNSAYVFGRGDRNVVTRYVRHNAGKKPLTARNNDWNNGVNYPEFYDMKRLSYMGLQSIYADHTSPLHSYFNVQIACNLTRIGHVVWRELSGDDQLDDAVFLKEVERRCNELVFEMYDDRVVPEPRAYYTALDTDLGTHWHLDWICKFKNIKTTQTLTVIAQRARNEEG